MVLRKLIRKHAFGGLFGDDYYSLSDNLHHSIAKNTWGEDSIAGNIAGGVATMIPYMAPGLGQVMALDDTMTQARKMLDNPKKNTLGDWATLGTYALGMLPVVGGLSRGWRAAIPFAGGIASAVLPSTAREVTLKKSEKTAVTKKPQEKKFNHYGKMMTAAEIKADNIKRALMKKQQAAHKAKMEAMLKAILAKLLVAQQLVLQAALQQMSLEQAYQAFDYGAYNIPDYER